MLQAKMKNKFHTDNSLLPSQIVAILPCKQSLLVSPLPSQTFLLWPKRIDAPKMVRKPVLWPQHPKVVYHGTSDPSAYDVTPVAQQAEVAATNAFAIAQRCYYRGLHLLYRKNQDIHSLAQSIQRCPEWNWIFAFSAFSFHFSCLSASSNSPLRHVFEKSYQQNNLGVATWNTIF